MIYSYIDTLLEKWIEWSDSFLSEKLEGKRNINSILNTSGADNPTRANELYKIGLLKFPLTGRNSNKSFDLLEADKPIHSNLGYLAYILKKANLIEENEKINKGLIAIKTIFYIQQYLEYGNSQKISLNYILYKLLELFPIPENVDTKFYYRYLTAGMFCELNVNENEFLKKITNESEIEIRIIDKKTNSIRATFNSSDDIINAINNNISLTGIHYEKGSTFLIGNHRSNNPRGLAYFPLIYFNNFLNDLYLFEKNNLINNPFESIFINKEKILIELNKLFSSNPNYKSLMKTLQEGSIEALKVLEWLIDTPITVDDDNFNIIFFGPPGTGKSHNADILTDGYPMEKVTFHPEYDYNSFVGGYKPVTDADGNIKYQFTPQIFTNIYVKAWNNPNQTHFLQIEEINRGNVAAIFGDLFQLLDRDENGFSKYSVTAEEELKKYLEENLNEQGKKGIEDGKIKIPNNLRIVATMNTSDQSLFPIDSAFKRRWKWKFVPINYSLIASDFVIKLNNGKQYKWLEFIQAVNGKIYEITQSPDKQIGNFFVNATYSENIINEETFINKVLFYLWNDIFKDENETIFLDMSSEKIYFEKLFEYDDEERSNIIEKIINDLGVSEFTTEDNQD